MLLYWDVWVVDGLDGVESCGSIVAVFLKLIGWTRRRVLRRRIEHDVRHSSIVQKKRKTPDLVLVLLVQANLEVRGSVSELEYPVTYAHDTNLCAALLGINFPFTKPRRGLAILMDASTREQRAIDYANEAIQLVSEGKREVL